MSDLLCNVVYINAMEMARQHPYWRRKLKDALERLDEPEPVSKSDGEKLKCAATKG